MNGMRSLQPACSSSVQQQRTSAFPGVRGVTACSDARWGFRIMHEARRAFATGAAASTKAVWWDLHLASLLMHLFFILFSIHRFFDVPGQFSQNFAT